MIAMAVRRMRVRYHLPGVTQAERDPVRRRLDGVVAQALGSTLDLALERAGVHSSDEVCIRSLAVRVRLRLDDADLDLAADWSVAVSGALVTAIQRGGDDVVRYRSMRHAVLDLAGGIGTRDLRRAWAWRQLGLWDGVVTGSGEEEMVVRALLRSPESVVPVLSELARRGVLSVLGPRFTLAQWSQLAIAAVTAARAPIGPAAPAPAEPGIAVSRDLALRAERAVQGSLLTVVLAGVARGADAAARPSIVRALAALAALEADPGSARSLHAGPQFRAAVGQILLGSPAEPALASPRGPSTMPATGQLVPAGAAPQAADRPVPTAEEMVAPGRPNEPASRDRTGDPSRTPTVLDAPEPTPAATVTEAVGELSMRPAAPAAGGVAPARPAVAQDIETAEPAGIAEALGFHRSSGTTAYGGLLFLLQVCRRIELADRLDELDALADRPVRWVMHSLATGLLPLADGDPAALAFAGLPPDAVPPSATEPVASPAERDALALLAARVVSTLVELLERPGQPVTKLVRGVCGRTAEIVADPGWIDVRLRLDQRTIEVRRAGLDLDPGYVPWLGVAVRFVYD